MYDYVPKRTVEAHIGGRMRIIDIEHYDEWYRLYVAVHGDALIGKNIKDIDAAYGRYLDDRQAV